jgi:large subunit ribosomal protein L9
MAKELLLLTDVEGLGREGDVVKATDGYARNFLLPRKLAAEVSAANRRLVEKKKAERAERDLQRKQAAALLAQRIREASIQISRKVSEGTRLFGSVTVQDLAEALAAQGIEIDKSLIHLDHPIRDVGTHTTEVRLLPDVRAELQFQVVGE